MHGAAPSTTTVRRMAVSGLWLCGGLALAIAALLEGRLHDVGRADLAMAPVVLAVYLIAFVTSAAVGGALVVRRGGHPVGWCFLVLAVSLVVGLAADLYARYGALARPGSLPAAAAVAHAVDPVFLVFFSSVALALQLIPTGRPLSRRWAAVGATTLVAATLAYVGGVLSTRAIDPPFQAVANPFAIEGASGLFDVLRAVGSMLTSLGLVAGGASVLVRFRRSGPRDRRQLWWLVLAVAPLPIYVMASFMWRQANNQTPLLLATAGFIVVIPAATWLCISRRRLFDLDNVVSRGVSYVLLTAVVVGTYVGVVVLSGAALSGLARSSTIAAVLGTLAAVSVAAPARRLIQDGLDRRFNRRRFDALRMVERHVRNPLDGTAIEDVLRAALNDPTLRVAYRVEERDQWVHSDGRTATFGTERPLERDAASIDVQRDGLTLARLTFDPARVTHLSAETVKAVATKARSELDNARLRAAISLQLVETSDSRARIAAAQLAERRRIERNLHDGAQQRLLALGLELRSAQLNGEPQRLAAAVQTGLELARTALDELRDLANGLCPPVLADGGLAAALDELSTRSAIALHTSCTEARFAAAVEETAWYVVCEAVTNAAKHARATVVTVGATAEGGWLTVRVVDDGIGGADPAGHGLQGLRDRAEAAGGTLVVQSTAGQGTTLELRLPCGR